MGVLRWLARKFWLLVITLVITLALVVQTGRILSPHVEHYRPQISAWLSARLGVPVQAERMSLRWQALEVALQLDGLRLGDAGQVRMGYGLFHLDLLASLWNRELVWKNLQVHDFSAAIRREDNGRWHIEGFPATADLPEQAGDVDAVSLGDPVRIFQLGPKVEVRNAALTVYVADHQTAQLNLPQVLLENSGRFHRLSARAFISRDGDISRDSDAERQPKGERETLRLVLEGRGNPRDKGHFAINGYLQLNELVVDDDVVTLLHRLTPLPERFYWQGRKRARGSLWLRSDAEVGYRLQGQLGLAQLAGEDASEQRSPAEESALAPLQSLAGDIAGRWQPGHSWQLALQDVRLDWRDQSLPPLNLQARRDTESGLRLSADVLELQPWSQMLQRMQLLQGPAQEWLQALAPEGRIERIQFAQGSDGEVALSANLLNIITSAYRGAPAVRNLNGYLHIRGASGQLDLDSGNSLGLYFPKLYAHPFEFERATGSIAWSVQRDQNSVQVNSGKLQLHGDLGEVAGQFLLQLPFVSHSKAAELTLALGLRDAPVSAQQYLVPETASEDLRKWLLSALGRDNPGRISRAGFIYRGHAYQNGEDPRLLALGEHAERQTVQLTADVAGGRIDYAPGWPVAREVMARLQINDGNVLVNASAARLWDITARDIEVGITPAPSGEGSLLGVRAQVSGPAQNGLRLLQESPLREQLGTAFDSWRLSGDMSGSLTVSQPLGGAELTPRQSVQVDLRQGALELSDLRLELEELQGRVHYDSENGLTGTHVNGNLWGRPLTAKIEHPGTGAARDTQVVVVGSAATEAVGEWSGRPELQWLEGIFDYRTLVTIPARSKNMPYAAVVELTSNLEGVAVNLPEPLAKAPDEKSSLLLRVPIGEQGSLYNLSYGEHLQGQFWKVGGAVERAVIALNAAARLPDNRGLSITGDLSQVDVPRWRQLLGVYTESPATGAGLATGAGSGNVEAAAEPVPENPLPINLDLSTDRLLLGATEIAHIHVTGQGLGSDWRLVFDSDTASGEVSGVLNSSTPLQLDLSHLRLPAPMAASEGDEGASGGSSPGDSVSADDSWSGFDFTSLPELEFSTDSLSVGDEDYGRWSFRMRPSEDRLVLSDIRGAARGVSIEGRGTGANKLGAQLMWLRNADGSESSQFIGRLQTGDLAEVQRAWGQEPAIESEYAAFDTALRWDGSPAAVAGNLLSGDLKIDIRNGRFLRATDSAGPAFLRLLSLFNFDTWARRLRLDFSDLYQSGMAFDQVRGAVHFEGEGQLLIAVPIQVEGPTSELQMAGRVNLEREDLDLTLVATLPVGNNLALVAALAGGLPAAAGVYLISKAFKKQVNKMASVSYRISGDWADPDVRFDKLFDGEGAQRQGNAAGQRPEKPARDEPPALGQPLAPAI